MTWTQPMCMPCWVRDHGARQPHTHREPTVERCCKCGTPTQSGIYVRLDPTRVPYPSEED